MKYIYVKVKLELKYRIHKPSTRRENVIQTPISTGMKRKINKCLWPFVHMILYSSCKLLATSCWLSSCHYGTPLNSSCSLSSCHYATPLNSSCVQRVCLMLMPSDKCQLIWETLIMVDVCMSVNFLIHLCPPTILHTCNKSTSLYMCGIVCIKVTFLHWFFHTFSMMVIKYLCGGKKRII